MSAVAAGDERTGRLWADGRPVPWQSGERTVGRRSSRT